MVRTHSTPTPRTARSMGCMVLRFGLTAREEGRSWPPVAAEELLSTITNTLRCLLNTALAMPEVRPLCQKPPSPMKASAGLEAPSCAPAAKAEALEPPRPEPMVVAPRWNGGMMENRWQPMSAETWCMPSSRSTSFSEEKIGRSGAPTHSPGGGGGRSGARAAAAGAGGGGGREGGGMVALQEALYALLQGRHGVVAAPGQQILAVHRSVQAAPPQQGVEVLLQVVGLAFLDHQHGPLATAEPVHLVLDQRVGDVQDVQRHAAGAEQVGLAQQFERAQHAVGQAAEGHDADVLEVALDPFVELALSDEFHRCGPALLQFLALVQKGCGRQHDAIDVAARVLQRVLERERRPAVLARDEAAVQVA